VTVTLRPSHSLAARCRWSTAAESLSRTSPRVEVLEAIVERQPRCAMCDVRRRRTMHALCLYAGLFTVQPTSASAAWRAYKGKGNNWQWQCAVLVLVLGAALRIAGHSRRLTVEPTVLCPASYQPASGASASAAMRRRTKSRPPRRELTRRELELDATFYKWPVCRRAPET